MEIQAEKSPRLLSLDVMRGLIMILLAAESCRLYENMQEITDSYSVNVMVQQFFHHPWNGLRFWDLVQPAFMTIAGTAMYISFARKEERGISWEKNFRHIAIRCFRLLICGVLLHCIYAGKLVWELWNVLSQLSVTILIAYSIIKKPVWIQLAISVMLLLTTELCYRLILTPGYDQPFTTQHNFGNFMDMIMMGKINRDGWVAFNFIPTAAHTIWGVLIGKVLINNSFTSAKKIKTLAIAGLIGLISGYGLDWAGITPVIKRIATSSFVLASGGWILLITAFLYWIIDIKKKNKLAWIAVVVGMNPIFIYMLFETVGHQWFNGAVAIFVNGFAGLAGIENAYSNLLSSLVTLGLYWVLCYWFYKKRIFFKL